MEKTFTMLIAITILAFMSILFLNSVAFAPSSMVTDITVKHIEGQTFIIFREIDSVVALMKEGMTINQVKAARNSAKNVKYNIYQSSSAITSGNIGSLSPVMSIDAFSAFDYNRYYVPSAGSSRYNVLCPRMAVIDDNYYDLNPAKTLDLGYGTAPLFPKAAGNAYYAVTAVINDVETKTITQGVNATIAPLSEAPGDGIPILQGVGFRSGLIKYGAANDADIYMYVRWENAGNAAITGFPFAYQVSVPKSYNTADWVAVASSLHPWGGTVGTLTSIGGNALWPNGDSTIHITSNQYPYDWWTGYADPVLTMNRETSQIRNWQTNGQNPVVRPYSQNRVIAMKNFVARVFTKVDLNRSLVFGESMGGSGSMMMGLRRPDEYAWVHSAVGVHIPALSQHFRGSYAGVFGNAGFDFLYDDTQYKVWDWFNDDWYLRRFPEKETAFISFSNASNDSSIGWKQAVLAVKAMEETRRPYIFYWRASGHSDTHAVTPYDNLGKNDQYKSGIDFKINQSQPAFTNCSLNSDMGPAIEKSNGTADINHVAPVGQKNLYLHWETDGIVTGLEKDRLGVVDTTTDWEMTIGLVTTAPNDSCTVDVTPRRLQKLTRTEGQIFHYKNIDRATGDVLDEGNVTADRHKLITLPQITVNRFSGKDGLSGGNRLIVTATERFQKPNIATLDKLVVSTGKLSPAFNGDIYKYTLTVPAGTASIRFTPYATSPNATVKVNEKNVPFVAVSEPVSLSGGSTEATITVASENGTYRKIYTIEIVDDAYWDETDIIGITTTSSGTIQKNNIKAFNSTTTVRASNDDAIASAGVVMFDISALTGKNIIKATLCIRNGNATNGASDLNIFRLAQPVGNWTATGGASALGRTQKISALPYAITPPVANVPYNSSSNNEADIDVTDIVKGWASDTFPNYGFVFISSRQYRGLNIPNNSTYLYLIVGYNNSNSGGK